MRFVNPTDGSLDRFHRGHGALAPEVVAGHDEDADNWEELLIEAGLPKNALAEVAEAVDHEAARRAWRMTLETIAYLGRVLSSHTSHSASLAHCLGIAIDNDGSPMALADLGARLGQSKQSIGNAAARLKKSFYLAAERVGRAPLLRPTEPGDWLTPAEIRTRFRISIDRCAAMGLRPARQGNRCFFEAGQIAAALAARDLAEATKRAGRETEAFEFRRRQRDAEQGGLTSQTSNEAPPTPK